MGGAWAQMQPGSTTSPGANQEIFQTAEDAKDAARKGNCIRFRVLRDRLKAIRQNSKNPFWVRHDLAAPNSPNMVVLNTNRELDRRIAELDQIECAPPAPAQKPRAGFDLVKESDDAYYRSTSGGQTPRVEMQAGGGGQMIVLPKRSMLGSEVGGAARLGLFNPDRDATGANASGSVKFNFGAAQHIKVSGFYAESKVDQNGLTLDPGAGTTLLIPGPNGGASGFSLGANPLNIVRDAAYSAELEKAGGRVAFGQTFRTGATGLGQVDAYDFYMATGYKYVSFDERFAGSIPGFARNFVYVSNADVNQFNIRIGAGFKNTIPSANGIKISFGGAVEAGPDFSSASGSDRLSFTGFADSFRALNQSKTDFGFGASAFVGFEMQGGVKIVIDGRYMRDTGLPVFVRDGTNPTTLDLKSGDGFSVGVSAALALWDIR